MQGGGVTRKPVTDLADIWNKTCLNLFFLAAAYASWGQCIKTIFHSSGWHPQADVQAGKAGTWHAQRCATWVPPPETCQPLAAAGLWQKTE